MLIKTNIHQANASLPMGEPARFFEVKAMRRWVWDGCRNAGGYATEADAREAFQLLGQADPTKSLRFGGRNRAILVQLEELESRGWAEASLSIYADEEGVNK